MSEHAEDFPPSGAPQWGNCSGSVRAQKPFPNIDSEKSRAGTAAHWVMAEVLFNFREHGRGPLYCAAYLGQLAPNGVIVDETMVEGAQVMVDDVISVAGKLESFADLLIEHRVQMPAIHAGNWGTLDCGLYVPARKVIYLWDYKHGQRECPSEGNFQLIDYMMGLLEYYQIDGLQEQEITVVLRIVQPFCYQSDGPVSEWVGRLTDLRGYWNRMKHKAAEALTDPTLSTGPWCRDCRAVGTCSAVRGKIYNFIDLVDAPYEMDEMDGRDLAVERAIVADGMKVAKARLEAIEDELQHRVRKGATDTGLALSSSQGREVWTVPVDQAIAMARLFDVDAARTGVLTPTMTRAKATKEMRPLLAGVMKKATHRPPGKLKLIAAADTISARAFKRK